MARRHRRSIVRWTTMCFHCGAMNRVVKAGLHLAHATRAGHDVRLRLAPSAAGVYGAPLEPLPQGHWRVVIEDPRGSWRIAQEAS